MNIDHKKLLRNTQRYALVITAHISYYAAQTFAFVACQLDDFNKYLTNISKRYES
jgi:hypothetical protein